MPTANAPLLRRLGRQPYRPVWEAMRAFTEERGPDSRDEVWVVEHEPVFTLGLNGRREHLLAPGDIPVVEVDRGGQVTYHGPGQLVVYPLVNLRGRGFGVRHAISALEQTVIDLLGGYSLTARARSDAPGVYVPTDTGEAKVASLGLRIRRGCSYHGLSLNVAMDLTPFQRINPCGHPGMAVTQLRDLGIEDTPAQVEEKLLAALTRRFGYAGLESAPAPDWQAQESAHG